MGCPSSSTRSAGEPFDGGRTREWQSTDAVLARMATWRWCAGSGPGDAGTAHRDGDEWLVNVRDNGIGIEAEFADKVFVIFQRLHARDAYEGTGIGLAIVKKIVEYHGGRIWLDLDVEEGTSINFTLPVLPGVPEPQTSVPAQAAQSEEQVRKEVTA